MNIVSLKLDELRIDGGTQPRTGINEAVVAEYAEAIMAGDVLPPVVAFFDGTDHWLADGFHRHHGRRQAGELTIEVDQRTGTRRDALLFSVGTNAIHGLRRSDDDKRKAVRLVLEDAEWGQWSDRKIAQVTSTSPTFVGKVRADLQPSTKPASVHVDRYKTYKPDAEPAAPTETRKVARGASEYDMKVRAKAPEPEPSDDDGPGAAELLDEMQADLRKAEARVAELEAALKSDGKEAVVKLSQRLEHAERRQAELQEDAAKLKQARDFYERQLARCGKAVGQRDLDKIAPAVEAFARAHAKVAA